jgi:hypothetical protein
VVGRSPGVASIAFKPLELFGATAGCLHLHTINPALATPESLVVSSLVEQHVDDTSNDFLVLASADTFKDYAKSYFAGTVAAGIAYLTMVQDGYVWADHFEEQVKLGPGHGNSLSTRTPDFVFTRPYTTDAALMESKRTRSAARAAFNTTGEGGYTGQVEPHLGFGIGSTTATHGYCIGASMHSGVNAEVVIHHTYAVPAVPAPPPPSDSLTSVQQGNYVTAFQLSHSARLRDQVRAGRLEDNKIPFVEIVWIGRSWLTSSQLNWWGGRSFPRYANPLGPWLTLLPDGPPAFAVEKTTAEAVLRALSDQPPISKLRFDFDLLPSQLSHTAKENGGAVFPDGLAVLSGEAKVEQVSSVKWSRKLRSIVPS